MSAPLTTYRVDIVEWNSWTIWVDAQSAEAAKQLATQKLCNDGSDDFKHKGCGVESVEATPQGRADQMLLLETLKETGRLCIQHIGPDTGGDA